jgi:hypothetical protein
MSDLNNINNISKKLADYFQSLGISEERVIELINLGLNNQVGKLTNLKTNDKSLIVNAINELLNVDLIGSLEDRLEDIEEVINTIKQNLIDKLVANGIKEQLSINDDWEKLINHIEWFNKYNYKDKNIYKFTVSNVDTIVLQNDLRGDTFTGTVYTDWGDGTIDTELSHTYYKAGTYEVKTKYSLHGSSGFGYDSRTLSKLVDVIDINKNITNANYMFSKCTNLHIVDGTIWDTSNITSMMSMFEECTNLVTVYMDKWDTSKINDIRYIFRKCTSLYY